MTSRRLVERPVFVLSCIRSGSTLLRCILDGHSRIYAPHELHLTGLTVAVTSTYAKAAIHTASLDTKALEYMLWDRLLHELLTASGKKILVEKTPGNALAWQRIAECWPHARFVFLLRDPADILASAIEARPDRATNETTEIVIDLIEGVEHARTALAGHEIRYEDLVVNPTSVITELCYYLDVSYEAQMLQYQVPTVLEPGIGDFTEKIRSGRILAGRTGSPGVDGALAEYGRHWGYSDV